MGKINWNSRTIEQIFYGCSNKEERDGVIATLNKINDSILNPEGIEDKHRGCRYFVLDMDHDEHARSAIIAYAISCRATHPELYADLLDKFVFNKEAR